MHGPPGAELGGPVLLAVISSGSFDDIHRDPLRSHRVSSLASMSALPPKADMNTVRRCSRQLFNL